MNTYKLRNTNFLVVFVFALILILRLGYINNSTAEAVEFWRQADTESIARNFLKYDFNIFRPQFNYDGPYPNYVQLELQITTFLIAILYKLFGIHFWLARLVPIAFFMGSAWFVYLIALRFYTQRQALLALFIYGIIPMSILYSRVIMPEPALLFFFTGAFYFFVRWIQEEKLPILLLSGIFTFLAISQKLPAIFIGIAFLLMALEKYKHKVFLRWELWLFALISLVPSAAYYMWAEQMAEFKFVTGIGTKHILPKFFTAITTPQAIKFYKTYFVKYFGLIPLILSLFGLAGTYRKSERPLLYWSIAMILELVFIVSVIRFRYYMIMLTPIIALLAGKALGWFWADSKLLKTSTLLLLLFVGYSSFLAVQGEFKCHRWIEESAHVLNTYTEPEDLIVIGDNHPAVLSLSDRTGWRANIKYYDYIPQGPETEINYFIDHGAAYFLVRKNYIVGDKSKEYIKYLKERFEGVRIGTDYVLYKLQ